MAAWRREALQRFPELRRDLNDGREIFSVYALWFRLLVMARDAHRADDTQLLARIYAYGEWCWAQSFELQNAVAVSFYEHLFDEPWMREDAAARIRSDIVRDVWPLLEARLPTPDLHAVQKLLRRP